MSEKMGEIQRKGKSLWRPSVRIDNRTIVASGGLLSVATLADEALLEGPTILDPESVVCRLRESGLRTDVLSFSQRLPETTPRFKYHYEWDNIAAIPITTSSDWLKKRAQHDVRAALKKASRLGVVVNEADFNDAFVEGIRGIYNESPIRQGNKFWHYHKDFEIVKRDNSTFSERSTFLGAYFEGQMIGYLKLVYCGKTEAIALQVISQMRHSAKKPTTALIAKAVEICEQRGISYLTYGKYVYRDANSSLTEFKRRHGFEKLLLPRYYIPLTVRGRLALALNLHREIADRIPMPILAKLLKIRSHWHTRRLGVATQSS